MKTENQNQSKIEEANTDYSIVHDLIINLNQAISKLTDSFDALNPEQKNHLFQEFESLNQNLTSITSWLSYPIIQRNNFKTSKTTKTLITHEDGTIVIKVVDIKNRT